jgi:hypothetical protein
MKAVYLDESGNTGNRLDDVDQPVHHDGALVVPESQWLLLRNEMDQLKKVACSEGLPETGEFHGIDIFHGAKEWKDVPEKSRVKLYGQVATLLEKSRAFMVIGSADKTLLQRYKKPMDPRDVAFWMVLEQIAKQTAGSEELVFIVADSSDPAAHKVILDRLKKYRQFGPPFGRTTVPVDHIIDTVHFMESRDSYHLQLCDMALYGYRSYRRAAHPLRNDFYPVFRRLSRQVQSQRQFPY